MSGFIAYQVLAQGLSLRDLAPGPSMDGLRVVASGVASIVLTVYAMMVTRANHAPACAITLIVSPGLLPCLTDIVLIMAAVITMFLLHRLVMLARKKGAESNHSTPTAQHPCA